MFMHAQPVPVHRTDRDDDLAATVVRERSRLGNFIRRRVRDPMDAEDMLQDVLQELVEAYRLPEPIEQASAWLFRVARNRIIDRFRKTTRRPVVDLEVLDESDPDYRLDLTLPGLDDGPEAEYTRSMILNSLQRGLGELPSQQRDVFIGHELEGLSFKQMSQTLGLSVNTLLSQKRSAVLHLRRRLQTFFDDIET